MLPRTRRVSKKLFQEVLEKGKSYHAAHFSLRVTALVPKEPSRFTFSVPKKLDTRATKRNYIKRKGLALLRPLLDTVSGSLVGIFFAKSGAQELSTKAFQEEIEYLVGKLK